MDLLESLNKSIKHANCLTEWVEDEVEEKLAVEVRNMHNGIHELYIVDSEEDGQQVIDLLKQIDEMSNKFRADHFDKEASEEENAEIEEQIEVIQMQLQDLVKDTVEINFRDKKEDGNYEGYKVLNDMSFDVY